MISGCESESIGADYIRKGVFCPADCFVVSVVFVCIVVADKLLVNFNSVAKNRVLFVVDLLEHDVAAVQVAFALYDFDSRIANSSFAWGFLRRARFCW